MTGKFYRFLMVLSGVFGLWIFVALSRCIAAGYFLFRPNRVLNSIRFYRALFPQHHTYYHVMCAWKQFQNFTTVFVDRFAVRDYGDITYHSKGWESFEATLDKGGGGIILMSHMGNWDVATYLLKKKKENMRLLLYMGIRNKEDIERIQKEALRDSGVKIIAVAQGQDQGSPFDILEGIRFLKSGGIVSLTGDMVWKNDQRIIPVDFLGHKAHLPEIPYILALLSGAPLFVFFTFRTGNQTYSFSLSEPVYLKVAHRRERQAVIQQSAQKYADMMEQMLRDHPFEWYHFEPFLQPAESRRSTRL